MAERSNTHELEVRADVVVKRFRSWDRGEPGREWRALTLLAEYAPGLAPEPVSADLDSDPPVIVMSRLAGDPLRGTTVTADRLAALAEAINTLQCAVPEGVLEVLAACPWNPASAVAQVRAQMEHSVASWVSPAMDRWQLGLLPRPGAGLPWPDWTSSPPRRPRRCSA